MVKNKYASLLVVPCALALVPCASLGVVRRPNKSAAYVQMNALAASAQYADQYYDGVTDNSVDNLPVRVANQSMADAISSGGTYKNVGIADLESCSRIYPNGEFEWATPTVGNGRGGAATCVAVVELRATEPVKGGVEKNPLLARAYLAAGDAFNCNISEFPEASYTVDAGNIVFPADSEPTRQDVVRVMNDEQKQNAGIKIAAITVAGALGGNIAGKNELGEDSLMGTGKHKMQSTAIGALGGAALGVGSVYAGKVPGDIILSTGVNAAFGAAIGNMVAVGDDVLRVEDCTLEDGSKSTCLWGRVVTKTPVNLTDPDGGNYKAAFYDWTSQISYLCDGNQVDGQWKNCTNTELLSVELEKYPGKTIDEIEAQQYEKIYNDASAAFHLVKNTDGRDSIAPGGGDSILARISVAGIADKQLPAMIVGVKDKTFGLKRSDWSKMRSQYANALRGRTGTSTAYKLEGEYDIKDFYPMYVSAEDGGIIDFSNKARMKGTLIGAGAGGAMGAFVAYQGAQNDIENRWVSAVMEYKDSLQKVYCVTGNRFLSYYNDVVSIPLPQ